MTNVPVAAIAANSESGNIAVAGMVDHGIQADQEIQVIAVTAAGKRAELLPVTPANQARIIKPTTATIIIINRGSGAANVELNQQ